MIKVLYLPLNYGSVVQNGMYDAIRDSGCDLEVFDYFTLWENNKKNTSEIRKRLVNKAVHYQPDIVLLQIQHTNIIDGNTIAKIKEKLPNTIICNYTIDVRNYVPPTYKDIARWSDYNLISSTGQIEFFEEELGKKVHYWQIGYNPKLYYRDLNKTEKYEWDVIFIANYNTVDSYPGKKERELVCKLLHKTFGNRFALFGHGWPDEYHSRGSIDQPAVGKLYHKAFCALSVSHYNDLNHYFSDRLLMCLASGRPTISLKFPKWESYFTDKSDIVIADSIEEIPDKVKWLLDNKDYAEFIGESGAAKVYAEHSYFNRMIELLEIIKLRKP